MAAARVFERDAGVDQLKGQLGGAAEQCLDVLGIVDAGQLHENAVLPLALDRRLLDPGLVDAAADDLDRLVDRLAPPGFGRHGAEADRPGSVGRDRHGQVRIDLGQRLSRIVDALGLADLEHDRVVFDREPGIADVGVEQRVAHIVDQRVEPLALGRGDIDLEQQVRAAAQVETQRHLLVREERGQAVECGLAQEVRRRQQHAERADRADQHDFPIGEIQHASPAVGGARRRPAQSARLSAANAREPIPSDNHSSASVPRPMPVIGPGRIGRTRLVRRRGGGGDGVRRRAAGRGRRPRGAGQAADRSPAGGRRTRRRRRLRQRGPQRIS